MYLDNAATTPLLPEVKTEIIRFLDYYGNPSSKHKEGIVVREKIEEVRNQVADIFSGNPRKVLFTSSGSASNNLVIHGLNDNYMYYYSPTCHKSMRYSCEHKKYHKEIKVDTNGLIDIKWLEKRLKRFSIKKFVLCYEMANSELGVYQNSHLLYELVHKYGGLVVADLTAFLPHIPFYYPQDQADFYTFSAHKIGALKGVGIVYVNSKEILKPLIHGAQEDGLFGGTENAIGIISLGAALKHWNLSIQSKFNKLSHYFVDLIKKNIKDCYIVAENCPNKIPQIMTICFKGVSGEELVTLLNEEGYYISTGSACNSGSLDLSPTLKAIKMREKDIPCCVRISFSAFETISEIENFVKVLESKVQILRIFS